MALFKRGSIWWYEFVVDGHRIRESSRETNQIAARRVETARKDQLNKGEAIDPKRPKDRFDDAVDSYLLDNEARWAPKTMILHRTSMKHLAGPFGKLRLSEITARHIARYQTTRKKEGASGRSINIEVGLVRQVLGKNGLWAFIQKDVHMLPEREDVGRALTADEQHRLLAACKKSASRSLYPAVLVSMHTGLRNAELRLMRWRQVDLLNETVTVGKSKTAGGEGRVVPLSNAALQCLKDWRTQFPDALPAHFVFPTERYGLIGEQGTFGGEVRPYHVIPEVAVQSWSTAWTTARKVAGVDCRWHDLRHSFVSLLAQGKATDTTITALAGWMSKKMMERYSHVQSEAKRQAISVLNSPV